MRQDPFPSPDDEEPPGSSWSEDGEGAEQGLFVCLPAEDLDVERFAQDGQSDSMPPGPLLAEVVHALTGEDGRGLAALSDDQLTGVIAASRRLESRVAWTQLAAIAEFAVRRGAAARVGGPSRSGRDGFAADELACKLRLTALSAAGQIAYACAVADRLPRTFAALGAGQIHPVDARIVADETSILSPEDAAEADRALAEKAGSLTFGQLRSFAHRPVLKLDPDAARKRQEAAKRDAHVRRFREASGNAGLVARELPPDEVLASWQHVEQRALDLRAAGLPGTRQELRGPCDHAQAEHRYRPGRRLQHLVTARNARCTAPGCGQPAARCDLDHTQPWEHGGPTCPCNIAPLCRHHHRCKQAEGWRLEQPEPGVLIWRVPSGRTYATTPTEYPI